MKKRDYVRWTPEDIEKLKAIYSNATWPELLAAFGGRKDSIAHRAIRLGLQRPESRTRAKWSDDEVRILCENYSTSSAQAIAEIIDREANAIHKKANKLGLQKADHAPREEIVPRRAWEPHEDQFLRESRGVISISEIAVQLGRSVQSVHMRSVRMDFDVERRSKPLGAERIYRGRLERKVSNSGERRKYWKRVDVIEWEAVNGPVPEGMVLMKERCKPRTIDNLRLMSEDDIPVIRARRDASPELKRLYNLMSRLGAAFAKIEKLNPPLKVHGKIVPRSFPIVWTPEEIDFLRNEHGSLTAKEIGEKLQLSESVVQKKRRELGLRRLHREWSKEDEALLSRLYRTTSKSELSRIFNRSFPLIYNKAYQLGLSRCKA